MKNKAHIFGTIGILLMLVGCGKQEDIKKAEESASCETLHWVDNQGMVSRTPQFNKADWLFVEQVKYKDESDALLRAVSPKGRAWEMSSQEVAEAYRSGYFATTKDESTPPERARSTLSFPTCALIFVICSSMNAFASSGVLMRAMVSGLTLLSIFIPLIQLKIQSNCFPGHSRSQKL